MLESALGKGRTISFNRQDLLGGSLEGMDGSEALVGFFRRLAEDSNICGVAISRIRGGGVYTHFFVKELGRGEVMRRTLDMTGGAFQLLELAAQDSAGYGSFIRLGVQTFDEAEAVFREKWDAGDLDDPYNPSPPAEDLDLLQIVRFE